MDRWTWMALKAYFPALYVAGVTVAAWLVTKDVATSPLLQSLGAVFGLIPLAGFGVALLLGLVATYQLWRWESGHGLNCHACGGMLGRERDGRYGAYRKCLACGTNINCKRY